VGFFFWVFTLNLSRFVVIAHLYASLHSGVREKIFREFFTAFGAFIEIYLSPHSRLLSVFNPFLKKSHPIEMATSRKSSS